MTNYNERLDEILSKTPCSQCDGSGAYPDYAGEPAQCQFCWQLRFTFIDKAKQAFTSLMKELVSEAKPPAIDTSSRIKLYADDEGQMWYDRGQNDTIARFEQNLLKALEEK